MESETLTSILDHWIGETPWRHKDLPAEGAVDLPFNLEEFCRQNDRRIAELEFSFILKELRIASLEKTEADLRAQLAEAQADGELYLDILKKWMGYWEWQGQHGVECEDPNIMEETHAAIDAAREGSAT